MRGALLAALAAAREVRLGYVLGAWQETDRPRSRIDLACAALAVEHANARDGRISSSLGALASDVTFTLAGALESGGSAQQQAAALGAFVDSNSIDVLLMDCWSSYAMRVAHALNLRRVPALLLTSTSPDLAAGADRKWYQFFRMYPTAKAIVGQVAHFIETAGWGHLAVLYAPDDAWSSAIKDLLAGLPDIIVKEFPLRSNADLAEDYAALQAIKRSGVRVVINLLWMKVVALSATMEGLRMVGADPRATGYAYLLIDEFGETSVEGSIVFGTWCATGRREST